MKDAFFFYYKYVARANVAALEVNGFHVVGDPDYLLILSSKEGSIFESETYMPTDKALAFCNYPQRIARDSKMGSNIVGRVCDILLPF